MYHKDSKAAGTAEVIISKQRNGPTDTAILTYLRQYTRFENFVAEAGYVEESEYLRAGLGAAFEPQGIFAVSCAKVLPMALTKNNVLTPGKSPLYERDFHKWLVEQAQALREGNLRDLDTENLAEEIEDMGRSENRAMLSQLARLMAHLLKWSVQKERRRRNKRLENSWRGSIAGA